MPEMKLPAIDLTKAHLLFEKQASGLYLPTWQEGRKGASNVRKPAFEPPAINVAGLGTTLVAIATFDVKDLTRLGTQIKVTTAALTGLEVHAQYNAAGDYLNLGLVDLDFTTPNYPILNTDIATPTTSIAVGDHFLDMDVSAFYSIQLWAKSGTSSDVDVFAGGVNG